MSEKDKREKIPLHSILFGNGHHWLPRRIYVIFPWFCIGHAISARSIIDTALVTVLSGSLILYGLCVLLRRFYESAAYATR